MTASEAPDLEKSPHGPCLHDEVGGSSARRSSPCSLLLFVSVSLLFISSLRDPSLNWATIAVAMGAEWLPNGRAGAGAGGFELARRLSDIDALEPEQLLSTDSLPILHQTVPSLELSPLEKRWRESWRQLGFAVRSTDDAQARGDVERLVRETGTADFLRVYDELETSVQRSDVWRYAILWLEGGVYADIDVVAHPPLAALLFAEQDRPVVFTESFPLFDWLPLAVVQRIARWALWLGLTDLVRLPQRRNCLMAAPPRHSLMLQTLELIVARFDATSGQDLPPEPTRTLELTGPGAYSDAVQRLVDEARRARAGAPSAAAAAARGGGPAGLRFVSRVEGLHYFDHVAQGSWKTYLDEAATHGGAKPHEQAVRRVLMLLMLIGLVGYWGGPYLTKPKPREQCVEGCRNCCRSGAERNRWPALVVAAAQRAWLKLGLSVAASPRRWRRRRLSYEHDVVV